MVERNGQQLGQYRLIQRLGDDEAGEVYLGMHISLSTLVAIKIVQPPQLEQDTPAILSEARTIAGLIHPNIVPLLDFGIQDEKLFLVMEYVPGETLRQNYPPDAHLSPVFVVSLIKQIANALQYAHDQNIVHGNIKPENILLDSDNEALLSDFGIPTVLQAMKQQQVQSNGEANVYIAPEQFDGRPQRASDQYALAVIAYEWLNGERPFQDLHTAPDALLREKGSGISPLTDEVLNMAMEKDPTRRFGSVQAFARALEQACNNMLIDHLPTISTGSLAPVTPAPISLLTEQKTQPIWQQEAPPTLVSARAMPDGQPGDPPPLPVPGAPSGFEQLPLPVPPQKTKNRTTLVVMLLILCLVGVGVTGTVFAVGPDRILQIVSGSGSTPQPTSMLPTSQSQTSAQPPPSVLPTSQIPTPILDTPTPTPQPTPTLTPEQQAQSVISLYYTAINNQDYQTAYNQWVNYPDSYQNFVNGFADAKHDDYQFGTILQQSDGTVQVSLTLVATSNSSQQTTYQGYYIVGPQSDGTWKIITASMR